MQAGRIITGSAPIANATTAQKKYTFTLGTGALAGNELYGELLTIAGGATTNLDINGALTNLAGSASVTVARVKAILLWLLAATDTAPDGSTTGSACSSVTVGNHATAGFLAGFGGATHTWTIKNGAFLFAATPDATGWATTAATTDVLKIVNDDGAVSAKLYVGLIAAAT